MSRKPHSTKTAPVQRRGGTAPTHTPAIGAAPDELVVRVRFADGSTMDMRKSEYDAIPEREAAYLRVMPRKRGGKRTGNRKVKAEADTLASVVKALKDAGHTIPDRGHWKAEVQRHLKAAGIIVSDTWLRDHVAALRIKGARKA